MSEFEERWAQVLVEAEQRAREHGRVDVADYLQLRAANDALRAAGIQWLDAIFQWLADEATRAGRQVTIERKDAHQFSMGAATMVGSLLTLRRGVRALMIEAGWPRAPQHGIVRGGGLASARVKHFGQRGAGEELLLAQTKSGAPQWFILHATGERTLFSEAHAYQHVARFLES